MRGKKAIINTVFAIIEEIVAIVCGFILPRIILAAYGSKYNGLITSITQFLACAVLLRSGIGGATRAALYKPLAHKDKDEINAIVKATDQFMKKIGLILGICIFVFSIIYPFFVLNEFEYIFTASLFIIIGLSTFAESFFGITYLIVLQADQKLWISSLLKSICYVLNTVIAVILIYCGCNIHIVKLGSACIYVMYPIILQLYVKKKYKISSNVEPKKSAIAQRWDAFWHQVAIFVMSNTDVIVLTIFTNMIEVSVYAVYNLIINGLKRTIQSFSNGLEAAFGNIIAKQEKKTLEENVNIVELILYSISTILYSVAFVMVIQFVLVYTKNINDADYSRPIFAYIMIIAQLFNSVRIPYQLVVQAAGHYKQTKKGAMIEPIINILFSVLFVIKFGLVGVAIGTLIATIFRTVQYSNYMSKNIVKRSLLITYYKIIVAFVELGIIILISNIINLRVVNNYFDWICNSIIVSIVAILIVSIINYILFHKEAKQLLKKISNIIIKKDCKGEV